MKTPRLLLTILAFVAAFHQFSYAQTQTWTKEQIPAGNGTLDKLSPTVVIDTLQNYHVLYAMGTPWSTTFGGVGSSIQYIMRTAGSGGSWGTSTAVESQSIHHSTALVLDSAMTLHFLYSKSNTMYHRRMTGGVLSTAVGITTGSYQAGAIDPNGNMGLLFGGGNYRSYVGGVWGTTTTTFVGTGGRNSSIALARDRGTHIVYADNAMPNYAIYYIRNSSTTANGFTNAYVLDGTIVNMAGGLGAPIVGLAVATDLQNNVHVVYTKALTTVPATSAVYYTNNIEGSWSTPTAISDTALYNRLAFVIDDNDALHVTVERKALTGGDWDIYYFSSFDGNWMSPVDISDNNVDDVLYSGGSRSIAVRDSIVALAYMTKEYSGGPVWDVALARSIFYPPSRILADPDTLDLGSVLTGDCRDSSYYLRNFNRIRLQNLTGYLQRRVGKDSAQFTQVTPTGTVQLATGDSSLATVRFCPKDSSGCYTAKFLYRATNGTRDSMVVKACAIGPRINVRPDTVDFGNVLTGACKDTTVTIYNIGGDSLRLVMPIVESSYSNPPYRHDTVSGSIQLRRLDSIRARIWFCPTQAGEMTARIIYNTSNTNAGSDTVYVRGNGIGPRLMTTPDTLNFGNVPLGICKDTTYTVINLGGDLLRVGRPTVAGAARDIRQFRLEAPIDSIRLGRTSSVPKRVSFCPIDTGCFTAEIQLNSNGGSRRVVVKGCAIPPVISIEPDTIDFGLVTVGSCKDTTFTITNTGQGWLIAGRMWTPGWGAEFPIRNPTDSFRVAPGTSLPVAISFCPIDTGCIVGRITIPTVIGERYVVVKGCGGAPVLQIEPTEIDFGGVPLDSCRDTTCVITNKGNMPLTVTELKLNSAQFTVISPTGAFTIEPGESQRVTLRFCPPSISQLIDDLFITSNTIGAARQITLRGYGVTGIWELPQRIDFGDVQLGKCRDTLVVARNRGNVAMKMIDAKLLLPFGDRGFSLVAPTAPRIVAAGDTVHLRLRYCPPDASLGRDTAAFDTERGPHARVALLGRGISGSLASSPILLDFGAVEVGKCARDTIVVTNVGGPPVELTTQSIEALLGGSLSGAFKYIAPSLPMTIDPGRSVDLVIEFCPGSLGGDSALFKGTGSAGSSVNVELRGAGVRNGVDVSPIPILFGCTLAGETTSAAVSVTNTGTTPITLVEYIVTAGAEFTAPSAKNVTIDPGATRVDSVRFSPTAVGVYVGSLSVKTSIGDVAVELRGEASVDPTITATPNPVEFGTISIGDTASSCQLVLTNPSCRPVTIGAFSFDNTSFRLRSIRPTPYTLAGNAHDTLCLEMIPTAAGSVDGNLSIDLGGGDRATVGLHGSAVQPSVVARPKMVNFGAIDINATSPQQLIAVTNLGGQPATITTGWTVTGANAGEFTVTAPSLPADLSANHLDTIWFTVTFTPTGSGQRTAALHIPNTSAVEPVVDLVGIGDVASVGVQPDTLDMGSVRINKSRTLPDTLLLSNSGTRPVDVTSLGVAGGDAPAFTIVGFSPVTLAVGESRRYPMTFAPTQVRPYLASIVATIAGGAQSSVAVVGMGVERTIAEHTVWIDSASIHVNTRTSVGVHLSPPIEEAEAVTGYTVKLRVDPRAIFPHGVLGPLSKPSAGAPTMTYAADGTITVEHADVAEAFITGAELFRLDFEGLVTGQPRNTIRIEEVTFREATGNLSLVEGIVMLSGCDVGRGAAFGRSVAVVSITPAPVADEATVTYRAPAGSTPSIKLIDVTGREVYRRELQTGNGEEQQITLRLDDVSSGFYLMELRDGAARFTLPVIVNR